MNRIRSATSLSLCIATTALAAFALWVPFEMQSIVAPHNEGCWGPFTDAEYQALLTIRLQTWDTSFLATGLGVAALIWLGRDRRWAITLVLLFAVWKTATLLHDIYASPVCWEPYTNDTPFWDEPAGLAVAILLQPAAFVALGVALIALVAVKWWAIIGPFVKNHLKRGN